MLIFSAALLTAACCGFEILFLRIRSRGRHLAALLLKGAASLCFCLTGILFAAGSDFSCRWYVAAGLGLGLAGDVLLALRKLYPSHHDLIFSAGALAFCLGHGCYMWALGSLVPGLISKAMPVFLVLVIGSELFARRAGFRESRMHLPGMIYIAVEALMCSMALALCSLEPGPGAVLFSLGGISFLISDNLLCGFSFGSLKTRKTDLLLHVTYLLAQNAIAWSILFL